MKTKLSRIRELLANDDLQSIFKQLKTLFEHSPKLSEIIHQNARFSAITKQIRLGIVSYEDATMTKNQIRLAVLELIDEIEIQGDSPELQEEVQNAISIVNSKNVVTGNIQAGGNVHIGDKNQQTIQYADKIYINSINEANFGFVTGKKKFNEHLTKSLIHAIAPFCTAGKRFSQKVSNIPNWEHQTRISSKAQEIISYSFVGVLGIQLSKLMAIGLEDFSEAKQTKYIKKCLDIIKRTFDLVNFSLLSKLWDIKRLEPLKPCNISKDQQVILTRLFEKFLAQSIDEQLILFESLFDIFTDNNLDFPITEISHFSNHMKTDSDFRKTCKQLKAINDRLDQATYTSVDCFDVEVQTSNFLENFSFLVDYNMVSIKKVGYLQTKNTDPNYLHRYTALGIDSKANVDAEKINYTPQSSQTDAIFLFKGGDYQHGVNLYPFIIDYNSLVFEQGAKICFYVSKNIFKKIDNFFF